MKKVTALLLSIIMCIGAMAFTVPTAAAAAEGGNLFSNATYVYQEYNSFLGSCTDTGNEYLNDGKVREVGGDVDFNDFYGVAGTTVEVAGTYDSTVIEFSLAEASYINRLVFRNVRRSGNRYMNIVSIKVSTANGTYTDVSFEEEIVVIDGAPLYAVNELTNTDQYFDVIAKFDEAYGDITKVQITLNTQLPAGNYQYVVSLDEIEAYGSTTGPYNPGADVVFDGVDSVRPGQAFTVDVYFNNITVPNGLVACDLPLVYDRTKLQLESYELIVPSDWTGKVIDLSVVDKNADPYWLRLACDADDLLTNDDYYVTEDNSLGFSLNFIATQEGTAEISVNNNVDTELYILAVDAANFKNYGVNGATYTVTISGSPVVPTYTVRYDANGGNNAPASQVKVKDVDLVITAATPVREGYTFVGWASSAGATTAQYQAGDSYTANASTTLYAVWAEGADRYLVGDVNLDGIINSLDAAQVLKHDAMLIAFDADALAAADVNGDGVANSLDATQILKHDAGLINIITGEILEGNRVLVQLSYATDEMINNTADYEHYTAAADYINGHFCFSASEDVQDFTIYSLADSNITYRAVYSLDVLRADKPLIASVYYGDVFTDVAISYYKDGVFYFYGLVYSGFDGSVSLEDIEYSIEY